MTCEIYATRAATLLVLALAGLAGGAGAAQIEVADGEVAVEGNDLCSLIEAIDNANDDAPTHVDCVAGDGVDTLVLATQSVYTLTGVHDDTDGPNGLPSITSEIVVAGNGAVIERSADEGTPAFRLFRVAPSGNLSLDALTLRQGQTAATGVPASDGGAILNVVGILTVRHSTLSDNTASRRGGGIWSSGTLTVSHSTLRGNAADESGGGIVNRLGTLAVDNSTLSGNSSDGEGGILSVGLDCTIRHSTLSGNANAEGVGSFSLGTNSAATLRNTVIADSMSGSDCFDPGAGITYEGVNLIEDGSCDCAGDACFTGDPSLADLGNNGGPTETHALLPGSIAIDKAPDDALCAADDQRGVARPQDGPGDGTDGELDNGCDLGAFEAEPEPAVIDVDPESLSATLEAGQTETQTLAIANLSSQTPLEWQVSEGVDCELPTWVGVDPLSGTVPADDSQDVDVTFDTTDLPPVDYSATLCILSNDPGQPEVTVLLQMTVTTKTGVFSPATLEIDSQPLMTLSDGNGVFEPGERVEVAPAWHNGGTFSQFLTGTASDLTGPDGPTYIITVANADYGEAAPDEVVSCRDQDACYEMEVGPLGIDRPALHWDATFEETLSDESTQTWTLHLGASFTDVPPTTPFYRAIESMLHHEASIGCTSSEYCPAAITSRAQIPIILLKAFEGPDYAPPACEQPSQIFVDVPFDSPACPWIEELANRDVTAGCGEDTYCPGNPVTRGQIAILLLKTLEGSEYLPPECTGVFADVPCSSLYADWVEELYTREITSGCRTDPPAYCPSASVTRGQMAALVTRTFGLRLYGP